MQQLLRIGDRVSEIAVLGKDYRDVDGLHEEIARAAGPAVEVLPWYELDRYMGTMLTVMDGFVWVWIVVVFLALSFGLVNTLVMAVFERVREIGLMLALGMTPRNILSQIVAESINRNELQVPSIGDLLDSLSADGTPRRSAAENLGTDIDVAFIDLLRRKKAR